MRDLIREVAQVRGWLVAEIEELLNRVCNELLSAGVEMTPDLIG